MVKKNKELTVNDIVLKKRLYIASIIIFLAIPITIATGMLIVPRSWFMPISTLVLIMTMSPFFMVFESRKPKAREIVLLAMISALIVAVHIAFHIIVPVQIGTAIVILVGISLGPEAGFLIGALSRFICNFYMGQGPWTPWQMFCWGLLGFLAGLTFNRNDDESLKSRNFKLIAGPVLSIIFGIIMAYLSYIIHPGNDDTVFGWRLYVFGIISLILGVIIQRKRLPIDDITLSLFTFCTVFIIYGGIMNMCKLILSINMGSGESMSFEALRITYMAGAPYDLLHAITASICVFFFGGNIIKKLERIKIKYGIYK